jgi:hypothetical protein
VPTPTSGSGARGFGADFWKQNYSDLQQMDCINNATAHARYLKASFDVVLQEITSVADLGFGLGHLFAAVLEEVRPYKALGIEPSGHAFARAKARLSPPDQTKLRMLQVDLAGWCRASDTARDRFDLGVCTSVLQYLTDEELEEVLPVMARRFRYVYLTVPSAEELDYQENVEQFVDAWAIHRPRREWRAWLAPHFRVVGTRLLESRVTVTRASSPFTDQLFRDAWSAK